jgi:hypothetical protein
MAIWPGPLHGFHNQWEPYIAGLDLALSGHHAAFVIVGVNAKTGKVRLVHLKNWSPKDAHTGRIDLIAVHNHIKEMRAKFRIFELCVDPWNAALSLQMLQADAASNLSLSMLIKEVVTSSATERKEMATCLVDAFKNGRLEAFPDDMLRDDLLRLQIVQKGFDYRIEAPEGPVTGHCDRTMALAMALPTAMEFASSLHVEPIADERELPPPVQHFGQKIPAAHPATPYYNGPGERIFRGF